MLHPNVIISLFFFSVAWSVMSTACAMCDRGHPSDDHDCRKNHSGSSKSMEPAAAVKLMAQNEAFIAAGVRVDVLVGDEDAATYCHVQQQTAHHVKKWIDTNHTTKKFSNKLYTAAKTHRYLSSNVIKYLKKCFNYAVAQNKDDVEGLKASLRCIITHTFGEHENCGEWCKAKGTADYLFQNLPDGKPFTCSRWRSDFSAIIESYVAKAEMIAPGGSSQRNESFNHMAVTRAPKSRFYGSTPALSYRVAAAVLQKNEGAAHIMKVNASAGLSPGGITEKYRKMAQERQKKRAERQTSLEFRRRRLFLKSKSSSGAAAIERRTGLSYVSGMSTTMERAVAATCELNAWIPEPQALEEDCVTVIVDTETTGFGKDAEIVQIAAKCGNNTFNAYMLPTGKIRAQASEKTGFTAEGGELYYRGTRLDTTPPAAVARDFLTFLEAQGKQVVLVGHNLLRFDAPLILRWMSYHRLGRALCSMLYGFTDTIPLIQQGKMQKQDLLAQTYLNGPQWRQVIDQAHNAVGDCLLLRGLLDHFKVTDKTLVEKAVTTDDFLQRQALNRKEKNNLPSLLAMLGPVKKGMLSKMARHGITLNDLKSEFQLHGKKGIEVCLGVQVNGKPRVTTNKRIVQSVCEFVEKML